MKKEGEEEEDDGEDQDNGQFMLIRMFREEFEADSDFEVDLSSEESEY